jgi:hypothetical protein
MLTSKTGITSLSWKVPFSKRANLLDCKEKQLETAKVEQLMQISDVDTFRNTFRKFIKKQISNCEDLQTALEIEIVLNKVGLKLSQFSHLSENTAKIINLIASAKNEAIRLQKEKESKAKKAN